jgi:hypothetical protein
MAASTSPADARRHRAGVALTLAVTGAVLAGCALFERSEPHASQDVIDAIYDGIRRAHEHERQAS